MQSYWILVSVSVVKTKSLRQQRPQFKYPIVLSQFPLFCVVVVVIDFLYAITFRSSKE